MTKEDGLMRSNVFPKEEKLCSQKTIDDLFSKGNSFIAYPLRIVYIVEEQDIEGNSMPAILISVSKKKFKRAVKRNRVKRLIREAYRLNKNLYGNLPLEKTKRISIAFLYLRDQLPTYPEIEKAMIKAASMLAEKMQE